MNLQVSEIIRQGQSSSVMNSGRRFILLARADFGWTVQFQFQFQMSYHKNWISASAICAGINMPTMLKHVSPSLEFVEETEGKNRQQTVPAPTSEHRTSLL